MFHLFSGRTNILAKIGISFLKNVFRFTLVFKPTIVNVLCTMCTWWVVVSVVYDRHRMDSSNFGNDVLSKIFFFFFESLI